MQLFYIEVAHAYGPLSSKCRTVIPRDLRRQSNLTPGQCLDARINNDRFALIPHLPMSALRGLCKSIPTDVQR